MNREIMPKVSVIIPVYNVEDYLEKCINSVCKQTFADIEIIVVNDGSTDNSLRLLKKFKQQDERIYIIDQENGGLSSARNAGIEVAGGDFIAFVDSDDWVDERYIEKLYDVCVEYDCDIAQCSFENALSDNVHYINSVMGKLPLIYTAKEFSYAAYTVLSWPCHLTWNKLYKSSLFENIRFPVGKIHEDEFTTYKLIWNAKRIGVISDKLYYYRYRIGSIMQQHYNKKRLYASDALTERAEFYKNLEEFDLAYLTNEFHLSWIKGQKKLVQDIEDDFKWDILNCFEQKEDIIKKNLDEGMLYRKIPKPSKHIFPFGKIDKGSRIIIYGGGFVGRQYYRQIYQQDYCEIVLWVDKNVEGCRRQGVPAVAVENISSCEKEWDYIVVAIEDIKVIALVVNMLQKEYGVPEEKIVY